MRPTMLSEIANIANAIVSATNTAISAIRGRKPRGRPLFGQAGTGPLSGSTIAEVAQQVAELGSKTSGLLGAIENQRLEGLDGLWSSWEDTLIELLDDIRTFNWYVLNVYYPATFGALGETFRADFSVTFYRSLGGPRSRWAKRCRQFFRRRRSTKNMLLELQDDLNALCAVGYRGMAFPSETFSQSKGDSVELIAELRKLLIALNNFETLLREIIRSNWTLAEFTSR
jgi:hypothetical protein